MYLLSVFLSIGTTVATFFVSGKVVEVILWFMTKDKGFERTWGANLTNLIGNLSVQAAFKFKDFNIFSTSSEVTKLLREKSQWEQDLELTSDLILTLFRMGIFGVA